MATKLSPEIMRRVMWDIKRETHPDDKYTAQMLRFRREVEAELAAHRVDNPDAVLDVPDEMPDAEVNVMNPYGKSKK